MATYDPRAKKLVELKNGGVYATADTQIHIPVFYLEKNLLSVATKVEVIGVFNVIIGDIYFVILSPLVYTIPVQSMQTVTVGDMEYYALDFKKGDVIIESLSVSRNATLSVELFITVMLRGKIPYYLTPDMALKLAHNTTQFAGVSLDNNSGMVELIASLSQRSASDNAIFFRHNRGSGVNYVTLTDVNLATFTNFSRLLNGYQTSGTITSLVNSNLSEPSKLEKVLRR